MTAEIVGVFADQDAAERRAWETDEWARNLNLYGDRVEITAYGPPDAETGEQSPVASWDSPRKPGKDSKPEEVEAWTRAVERFGGSSPRIEKTSPRAE